MKIRRITSRENLFIRTARLAATQARKSPPELVLAEGVRVLEELLDSNHPIEYVLIDDGFGSDEREARLVHSFSERNIQLLRAPQTLLKGISGVSSPQGAIAVVRLIDQSITDLNLRESPLLLCADEVQDPGNLGTLGRSAQAAGATAFLTTKGTASLRNRKTIRASAGALFHLPWIENLSRPVISQFCRENEIAVFLASPVRGRLHWEVDFRAGGMIVMSNETRGVEHRDWPGAVSIHVPMTKRAESLNVASAGAVILFEAFRQRYQDPKEPRE